ncbi:Sodium-coupled neutral amino acid transporter like protein [Argiope bruennichi]|uniref:Sodium-coupled neutral amino acid transporter like protein n=1 Tax=Argiope bruennichi TaxID=94029 RepID=A0A8T0EGG4_ARGBR|nr:Sodium-coupled neutral amino acid transporter like protein [Argiope bruennichi]
MEPDSSTPLLTPDESLNRGLNTEDEVSSDSGNSTDNTHRKKRRQRLPFHYPHVHKSARMRREAGSRGIATYHRYRYYNKLADPTIDTLSIPNHVVPHTFLFPLSSILTGKQGSLVTIFSIWNTMMGSSLLSMPWAIQEAGFAAGLIILFVMGGLCFYTAYRIVSLRSLADLPSSAVEFPDLCRLLLGPWAEWIATFFSLIPLLGGAVVYWVLMSNFLYFIGVYSYESFHIGVNNSNVDNSSFPDVYCPTTIPDETLVLHHGGNSTSDAFYKYWNRFPYPLLCFFPPCTVAVIVLILFIIAKGVIWGINFNTIDPYSINYVQLFKSTFPVLVGTLSLSFFIHNCVLSLMRNQKNLKKKECIEDNLLNNFKSNDSMALAARIFLLFQVISLYPLIVYILRVQIMHFFYGTTYPSWKPVFILNISVITVCILFNIFYPKVGTIIRYCGAVSGLAFIFTLPCITYMKALHEKKQLSVWNAAIHVCIMILGKFRLTESPDNQGPTVF